MKIDLCSLSDTIAVEEKSDKYDMSSLMNLGKILEQQRKLNKEIIHLRKALYTDFLTKAYTRKWLEEFYIDENKKMRYCGTIAVVDLDKFKTINDNFGHKVGDDALRFISLKLMDLLDGNVNVVRYGGDEFLLFIDYKECSTQQENLSNTLILKESLEQLKTDLKTTLFHIDNKNSITLSFSFGVKYFKKGTLFDEILEKADIEMYKNKKK